MWVECYRIINVMDWFLELCINWGISMVVMLNFPQETMKSPCPQFMNLWCGWIVEGWISWECACSNWNIWIMLLSMSNVVTLDVLINHDHDVYVHGLWILENKVNMTMMKLWWCERFSSPKWIGRQMVSLSCVNKINLDWYE